MLLTTWLGFSLTPREDFIALNRIVLGISSLSSGSLGSICLPLFKSYVRWVGLKWSIFLIGPLYLIGVWFGEDQRANIVKTNV